MSLNDFGSPFRARAPRVVVAALLLGTAIGAGGVAWTVSSPSFAAAPLSAGPMTPQAGFAPLVARVKPAVVQVTTVSRVGAGQDGPAI